MAIHEKELLAAIDDKMRERWADQMATQHAFPMIALGKCVSDGPHYADIIIFADLFGNQVFLAQMLEKAAVYLRSPDFGIAPGTLTLKPGGVRNV